jgi:hypothetical protein
MSDNQGNNDKRTNLPTNQASCDCSSTPNCCALPSDKNQSSWKWIKTTLFIVIMLAAVAVAAYSILDDKNAAQTDATAEPFVPKPNEVFAYDLLAENDFAYVTLTGAGAAENENIRVTNLVDSVARIIRNKGNKVITASLLPGDEIFSKAVDLFKATRLPAVMAVNQGGGLALIDSSITENSLLTAYLTNCKSSAACCPAGSTAACDPKACDK